MNRSASPQQRRYAWILTAIIALVTFTGCTLTDNDSAEAISGVPVVAIASPLTNATYADGVNINVQASVSNAGEDIDRVIITLNGAEIETVPAPNPVGLREFSIAGSVPSPGIGNHNIAVTAFRSDNSGSEPVIVNVSVVDGTSVVIERGEEPTAVPTEVIAPTDAPPTEPATDNGGDGQTDTEDDDTNTDSSPQTEPTDAPPTEEPEPTDEPATSTPAVPMAVSNDSINVRSGPSIAFEPPVGAFNTGERAEILATNLDGTWLKIRRGVRSEGWVFTSLVTVEGNITGLPREAGPPTPLPPTPVPPTAIPATQAPAVTNNLVPVQPFIDPPQPQCGQNFNAGITIRNDGSGTLATGLTRIQIVRVSDNQVIATSGDSLVSVSLPPGGTHTVAFTFNVDVFVNEQQRVVFIADVNNQVTETIETDNQTGITYTLPPCS